MNCKDCNRNMRFFILTMLYYLCGQGIHGENILDDYVGCHDDPGYDWSVPTFLPNNSRWSCKSYCSRRTDRYAGTKNGFLCLCGNKMYGQLVDKSLCNIPCAEKAEETCGGSTSVQIYDTWPCSNFAQCDHKSTCWNTDNGRNYQCICSGSWTGKYCNIPKTDSSTSSRPPTRPATIPADNASQNVYISSTIVGHSTDRTLGTTKPSVVISKSDTTFSNKLWFKVLIIVVPVLVVVNSIGLVGRYIYRRYHKDDDDTDSEFSDNESDSIILPANENRYCIEMNIVRPREESVRYSLACDPGLYDCIDDLQLETYENMDLVNRCEGGDDVYNDSGLYDNIPCR